jgi:hypothetical protein
MGLTRPTLTWTQQETFRLLKGAPGSRYQEASEVEQTIIRDWIRGVLHVHAATICFVKADGTPREMHCTLDFDLIPDDKHPKESSQVDIRSLDGQTKMSRLRQQADAHTLRVFDLDKQEWRSFRFDRLKKIKIEIGLD